MDVTFDEVCLRMKCKDLEVKETKTMMGKTQFEVGIPTSEARDEKEVMTYNSSTKERKPTMASKYQLAHDRVRRDIVPPQGYRYVNLIWYTLIMAKVLQGS